MILCDFDGTATEFDTLNHLGRRFAPEAFAAASAQLHNGTATLREILEREMRALCVSHDEIVATAVAEVPPRTGLVQFVRAAAARSEQVIFLSAGFRQLIDPMLRAWGIGEDEVQLIANEVTFQATGAAVSFRANATCPLCGQWCKRPDVDRLRDPSEPVIYVGDGYSDRCASRAADAIFARGQLADYLHQQDVEYTPFDSFHDIASALWRT